MGNQSVITAGHCAPEWSRLPQLSPLTERWVEYEVPDGSVPGCILEVPIEEGVIRVPCPPRTVGGDMICVTQREDGTWRHARQTAEFTFQLPPCLPGDTLKLTAPDGSALSFEVPQTVQPEAMVCLERLGTDWAVKATHPLPEFDAAPVQPNRPDQYQNLLMVLLQNGYINTLRGSPAGTLHINVPFCGKFSEYPSLCNFVEEHILTLSGVHKVVITGADVVDVHSKDWAVAQRWASRVHPQIKLHIRTADLAQDALPISDFVIGLHPEVTHGQYWFQIIGSIVRGCTGGLCVFATYFENEMKTLLNMIAMYKSESANVEVYDGSQDALKENYIIVVHQP